MVRVPVHSWCYCSRALFSSSKECKRACEFLKASTRLAVDCEGENLSRHGPLALVQIASDLGKRVYVFDVIALTASSKLRAELVAGLKVLLEDDAIVKVLHDCRQDAVALFLSARRVVKEYHRYAGATSTQLLAATQLSLLGRSSTACTSRRMQLHAVLSLTGEGPV